MARPYLLVLLGLVSCGGTVRSVTDSPLRARTPQLTSETSSALVVYSDIEGEHLPPRATAIKAGSRLRLTSVACERQSENWGAASWSCRADDTAPTPDERRVIDRAAVCFELVRSEPPPELLRALSADSRRGPVPVNETYLVLVRITQVNRTKEVRAIGCEGVVNQPCDPIGAEPTGRTLEQVTRSRDLMLAGVGAPADPYLTAWPFPAWSPNVTYAKIETAGLAFPPATPLRDGDARRWLEQLSHVDEANLGRSMRLALRWDLAVLALRLGDRETGERALLDAEKEIAPMASREPIDSQIVSQAGALHALVDGTLSLADPCGRR